MPLNAANLLPWTWFRMPEAEQPFPGIAIHAKDLQHHRVTIAGKEIQCTAFADAMAISARWPDMSVLGAPLWAEVWPAEHDLVEWLCRNPECVEGKQVLELGCGTGFATCALAALGAEVTATDAEPHALTLTRFNARHNQLSITTRVVDWNRPETWPDMRYPCIMGADIVYDPDLHAPLWQLIANLLAPGGILILADPDRREAAAFRALAPGGTWTRDGRVWVWKGI